MSILESFIGLGRAVCRVFWIPKGQVTVEFDTVVRFAEEVVSNEVDVLANSRPFTFDVFGVEVFLNLGEDGSFFL